MYGSAVSKRNGNNLQPNTPPANTASSQTPSVQEEVAEELNKERRKLNVVIFKFAPKFNTLNEDSVEELFLDLVPGANATPLTCNRLGNSTNTKPLLVKFNNEKDKAALLRNANKLNGLKDKYSNVSIAPDRTKREKVQFRKLRQECNERRKNGEHVIISNNAIVLDKYVTSPVAQPSHQPSIMANCKLPDTQPLLVHLPPEDNGNQLNLIMG